MSIFSHPQFLRRVLWADAAAGVVSALLHLIAAEALAPLFGLPQTIVTVSGLVLVGAAALAMYLAICEPIPRGLVGVLIAGNFAWVAACAVVFAMNLSTLTWIGEAYLIVNALAVGTLAELEWFGLRRAPRLGWA